MAKVNRKYPEGGLVYKNKSAAEKAASKWAGTNEESLRAGGYKGEGTKIFKYYDENGNVQSLTKKHTGMTLKMIEKSDKKSKQEDNRMKRGGRVRVNKKYKDGGMIYDSKEQAMEWGSSWANDDSAQSDTWPDKTFRYEDENGEIKEVTFTHNREIERMKNQASKQTQEEELRKEIGENPQYLKNLEDAFSRPDEESEREYKNGGRVKPKKKKRRLNIRNKIRLRKYKKQWEKLPRQHYMYDDGGNVTDKMKERMKAEAYTRGGGAPTELDKPAIAKGEKGMAVIIAVGKPKANKKSGPKAPIRAKKKKYDNGGIPIPEDTGTDSTVYNSEREAEAAAQKWASDGLPLKGGKCSMRFGYREVVDGVAKKIKYVTYTKDECAEGIIKESQKKKERETAREEWEQSPEGQKSLDKNQASFVRMINEAYEESKRNQ